MSAWYGFQSYWGRRLGIDTTGKLWNNGKQLMSPCVDATITVGAEAVDVRPITIQLLDAWGQDITYVENVEIIMYANSSMTAYATTGGSTGIAISTDGALLAVVAKKYFLATSEADGDIDLTWTDTGTEAVYLGIRLPSGRVVLSDVIQNAP